MGTFKLEIGKKFGTFRAKFAENSAFGAAAEQEFKDITSVVDFVKSEAGKLSLEDDDSVVFRGIAYTSVGDLTREVKHAPY